MSKKKDVEFIDLELVEREVNKKNGRAKKSNNKKLQKERKKAEKKFNREYAVITYVFLALFLCMSAYFIYFVGFKSESFINSSYNTRITTSSPTVVRGDIKSADGEVLAYTTVGENLTEERVYPYKNMYAHSVGYVGKGMSGIELESNFYMLRCNGDIFKRIFNDLKGSKNQGNTVVTTLNNSVTKIAYDSMGSLDGAVIAIEPSTGKIVTMISKPDFNPTTIEDNWNAYSENKNTAVLVNRAIAGLYPPGSTFKIVTTLGYIRNNPNFRNYTYDCNGTYTYSDFELHCYNRESHGRQDIYKCFANSCNCAYADIGTSIDVKSWNELCDSLYFNKQLPAGIKGVSKSTFNVTNKTTKDVLAQTSIGQGDTLVTPIHMAMLAAAICNGGEMMKPYMVDKITNDGYTVKKYDPKSVGSIMTVDEANTLSMYMRNAVLDGTASKLASDEYVAFGKTGTAEYNSDKNDTHSWFVGFAKDDNGKELAIAVVLEGAGTGSKHAVPLAKKVFDVYFAN